MNKAIWYIKRLSCMSIEEIAYRTYKFIKLNLGRFVSRDVNLKDIWEDKKKNTNFYFDPRKSQRLKQEFIRLFPNRKKDVVFKADRVCNHRFKIFNLDWNAGKDIDWHEDIVRGKKWPLKYWTDIDFRNDEDCKEVRFIWELNRHQHLVGVGKAYLLTQDIGYADQIKTQILSWIKQNPAHMGVNWSSPLEVSLRLISWCWAYKSIETSEVFSRRDKEDFLRYIYLQTDFVKDNLSRYSSANNHLIGEACGLIITGLTFPGFKCSGDWVNRGRKILFNEILKQTYPDGVTKEQAFHYQAFVMDLCLSAIILLIKNEIEIPKDVIHRYFKMCEFVMNIMDTKGSVPNIGDSDNGIGVGLYEREGVSIFRSLLSSGSILFGRGDFKEKGSGFREEHYWLFGMQGFERYRHINSIKVRLGSRLFKKGGYAVFRKPSRNGKEKILIMDCGELGYSSIAAHGHADLMSITLSSDGVRLLVDPGTYLYHTANHWRDYFRGTSAHNTITVNDKNQSKIKGPFMWGDRLTPRVEKWKSSEREDYISVLYNNCRVTHRRTILFNKEREVWTIKDFLNVKGENRVRQYFHLPSTSLVREIEGNIVEICNQGIFLYLSLDKDLYTEIKRGEESPVLGWYSDIFGTKVKSPTLINTATILDRGKFDTLLYVSRKRLSLKQVENIFSEI